jgi:acylpyruvate hydrolase
MRFVSAEHDGRRFAGVLEGDRVVPLEGIAELGRETRAGDLAAARRLDAAALALGDVTLRPVVPRPGKILCVGLNYRAHIEESKRDDSGYPVLFTKFASALIGPYDDIVLPPEAEQPDYEAEVAVVVGEQLPPRSGGYRALRERV